MKFISRVACDIAKKKVYLNIEHIYFPAVQLYRVCTLNFCCVILAPSTCYCRGHEPDGVVTMIVGDKVLASSKDMRTVPG